MERVYKWPNQHLELFADIPSCTTQDCQTNAWKHAHKYECKIFKNLYPQVLPNTARMILQILLRQKHKMISQVEWDQFLKLKHHIDDIQKAVASGDAYHQENLENIQLMARAGQEYSGSTEPLGLIETLVGRVCFLIHI
jgi:hypothetical protein